MKYCKRCLYPENHPLNLTFDEQGICSGCRIHEEKDFLDWSVREKKLKSLLEEFKSDSKSAYDCIIPVSGARDSYFIVHTIKRKYGLNPLLVTYNKQYNTQVGIRNLAYLRTIFDCDLITMTVSPEIVKKITRSSLLKIGSIYWHCIAGQTVFPVQIAVRMKIPLIIWGVHQGCDQVGMFSHLDEVEMTRKYRKEHDLIGFEAEDLIDDTLGIKESDVRQYMYPHDKEIEKVGVRGIYLSNFIRWDSKAQHEQMINFYNYESFHQERTFDTYNDVDCYHYSDLHDYIKFLKWGYGKVTDHACRELRLNRLTRENAIELVEQYQDKKPKTTKLFIDWLGITEKGLFYIIDQFRDPRIWKLNENNVWNLKDSIVNHRNCDIQNMPRSKKTENCSFILTPLKADKLLEKKYMLLGKGYIES